MKKILILFTLMIGMTFVLSSCDNSDIPIDNVDIPIDDTEITYVISYFDENTPYLTQNVKEGESAIEPSSPSKDNFTFEYWTLDSTPFSFDTIIENDIELQAKWEAVIEIEPELEPVNNITVTEDGLYTSKDEVALYIATFHKLPSNYMTKSEAGGNIRNIWTEANKASIGGDTFGNREGLLPAEVGRTFIELDINYSGVSRGALRIVYSSDFRIFYTDDHYDSFVEYDKETREWKSY